MKASLVGALEQIDKYWNVFEHKGKPMTKDEVRKALVYGIKKGYEDTSQLTDEDIDIALLGEDYIKNKILITISDLCSNFLFYDRKEDSTLDVEKLNDAVKSGKISVDEMVAEFRKHLEQTFKDIN